MDRMGFWGCFRCAALLILAVGGLTETAHPQGTPVGRYAPVHGLSMYYEIHGSGPTLVLLHGGGSTIGTTFGQVLPALSRRRRVIAIEQQGHGHTADIDRPLSFERMADDTAALLRQLGVERADVFGFSNGANVAMQVAIRHGALVNRLVVGSAFFRNDGLHPAVRESFKRGATPADMPPPLREAYLSAAPRPQDLPVLVNKLMAMLSGFQDWPAEALRGIKAPTLVLQGNADVASTEHAAELCRLIPACTLTVLPGGHGTYIGEVTAHRPGSRLPEMTVALIEEFLDGNLP